MHVERFTCKTSNEEFTHLQGFHSSKGASSDDDVAAWTLKTARAVVSPSVLVDSILKS